MNLIDVNRRGGVMTYGAKRRQKINLGGLLFIGGYDILDRKNKSEERLYGKA